MTNPSELIKANNYIAQIMKQLKPVEATLVIKPSKADFGYSGTVPL